MSFDTYPVAGEPDPTADAVAILASEFHEGWRGDFAQPDGSFTSRIKVYAELPDGTCKWYNEADVPADATEHKRQDIANTAYHELDPDWQAENKAAAEVVVAPLAEAAGRLDLTDPAHRSYVGGRIHDAWLERNGHARGGALGVPFDELDPKQQQKDIDQIETGLRIFEQ